MELHHHSHIQERLWELGEKMEIVYQKMVTSDETVKRVIQPVALLFSEYYFYLNAYIVEPDENGDYVQKYDYPAVFRLDRILQYKELGIKFSIPYADRFEEGEFRKRIQFMFPGKLVKLQFYFRAVSAEAILDRLPTARVLSRQGDRFLIEAEVYGKGVLMWLLSQGERVEILKPAAVREEMKRLLTEMLQMYSK